MEFFCQLLINLKTLTKAVFDGNITQPRIRNNYLGIDKFMSSQQSKVLIPSWDHCIASQFTSSIVILIVLFGHIIGNRLVTRQKLFSDFNHLFAKIRILLNVMKL